MRYKVYYSGFYYIEADSVEEALETDRSDSLDYEEWENNKAVAVDEFGVLFEVDPYCEEEADNGGNQMPLRFA